MSSGLVVVSALLGNMARDTAATAFWRKAIRYPFQEHEQGTEIVQSFTTGL